MSSFRDLVKKVNEEKKTTSASGQEQSKEKEEKSSFRDLVRDVNNGTIKVASTWNSSEVESWYKGVSSTSKKAYDYLSTDGYRKSDDLTLKEIESYLSQANYVGQYLNSNKGAFDNYDDVIKNYNDKVSYLKILQSNLSKNNQYFSQFASADDYERSTAGWLNPDAETNEETVSKRKAYYQKNEDRIEEIKSELPGIGDTFLPTFIEKWFLSDEQDALKDEMEAKKAENLQYKRTQGTMDEYYTPVTPEFKQNAAYRDYANPTREELHAFDVERRNSDEEIFSWDGENYRDQEGNIVNYSNDPGIQDKLGMFLSASDEDITEAYNELNTALGDGYHTWAGVMQEGDVNGWKYLESNEIDIYYDLYKREGQEAAYKFLSDMTTELTRRATQDMTDYINEAPLFEQIMMNAASVPATVFGGIPAFIDDMAHIVQGEDINPYSRAHSFTNAATDVRSKTATDIEKLTGNVALPWVGTTFGDVYQSLMSAADSFVGSAIGGKAYGVFMGMGAASNEMRNLYEKGADINQIAAGGILAGAAEMVFEKISIDKLVSIGDSKTIKDVIVNYLKQAGIEASEEVATEIANTITNAIVMGSQSDWVDAETFAKNVVNAGIGGFLSGGVSGGALSAASYAQNNAQYKSTGKAIKYADGGMDALKALANEVAGASEGRTQKQLNKQISAVDKNATNRKVGKLFDAVQDVNNKTNAAANKADIVKSLVRNNIDADTANDIAQALVDSYNGKTLTEAQTKLLESVKGEYAVQNAISKIVANEQSTMGQRSKNIRDFREEVKTGAISKTFGVSKAVAKELAKGNLPTVQKPAEQKKVSDGSYEVSENGKTVLDGKEVEIAGLRKMEDGSVMVATTDGQTADPGEVAYPSKGHALVYENYANIETTTDNPVIANMDVADRSALANVYSPTSGVDAKVQFLGLNQSYWYGFEGISMDEKTLPKDSLVRSISEEQRAFAYDLGKKAGEKAAKTQDAGVKAAYEKAVEKLGGKEAAAAAAKKNEGSVVLEDNIRESSMTRKQRASYKMADIVAKAVGTTVHIYHGMTEYGKYNTTTGEIWLNINGNFQGSSMMAFTLAHELVHLAKQWKNAEFKAFADYLLEQYGKKGVSVEALIKAQMDNAKENGYTLNEHEAYEEVIADACMRMLLDSDALQKMAGYREQNPGNWQKIVDAIKKFIANIRKVFQGAEPDAMEADLYKELDDAVKKELEDKFVTMVMDAGEHLSTIRNAFGKGTVVEVNADGEFALAKGEVEGSTKFLYNDYTWEKGGRETLAAALKAEGFSKSDINAALTIMDGKHKLVKELAEQFPEQDRINQATITTDLKDGHSVLSALVSNGDYPVNIDLLMVCKKRKAYQRVINRLCETGMIQQATVDALAIAEINKILGKYGFETACLGCFVESRRLRIQEWANTIVKEWNAEVKKRNPNAKAFGFGKGEATLTPDEVMKLVGELESGGEKNDQGNLNLGQGSAVKRMGVLLDKVPSLRKTLSIEDLITPDGLTALRKFDSNLFSMVKSRYGSNSPKFVQEFNPYNHELAMYGKVPTEYKSLREYLYAIGGARMQSFSDFIVENWFDYCQIVADLAARKLPMHTYTKEIALVKLFGLTGIKINMSLIPDIDRSLGKEFAGLTRNAKGELELIWADKDRFKATGGKSYMQSINFADAIALQNDPRYSANVGTIAVGVSDKHILMMLDDNRIRMIIPYHSSGMNPIFADLMGTSYYKDYTMFQNTTVKQLYNSKGQPVSIKLDKTQTAKLTSGFQFNEVLQELGDARAAAQAYKEWCADASKHTITIKGETYTAELTPKFNDFSSHENYYKLLEDFNTYDCISEQAAPQGDVQQNYPEDFDKILKDELTVQENQRQKHEANQSFDKAMGEIESYLSTHTKADTVFYAEQHGVKLGAKDKKLGAEDKKKLADLRKGEKYAMPKSNNPYSYEALVSKPDMMVATVGENVPNNRADLVHMAKQNAAMVGKIDPKSGSVSVYVKDIGRYVGIGRDGLKHSLDGGRISVNAPVLVKAGEIISNSIRINELTPREDKIDESYVLIGAARNADNELYIVRSVVNRFSHKLVSLDVLYAINAKKEPAALLPLSAGNPALGTDSTISIAKLLDYVNQYFPDILPEEVLKYYGHDSRPEGELGKDALYKKPNSRGMSSRQLLADAFDELVQTRKERELMDEYRNNIAMVEEVQERLRKLRGEISKLTKSKGDKAKIDRMSKTARELAELIDKYDRKLLDLEASKPLRDVLDRAKSAAYKEARQRNEEDLKEYRQQVSERFDRGVHSRRKTEMRKKIRKVIRDLDKILNRGNKQRNVKEDMKDFVAEALSAAEVLFTDNYTNDDIISNGFGVELSKEEAKYLEEIRRFMDELSNLPSGSYDAFQARQEAEESLKGKIAYRMSKLKDAFFRERQRLNKAEVAEVLGNLADAYAKLETSEYAYVNGAYHEAVYEYLKMLQEDVGGAKVKDMTLGQLEELYKAYTMVLTTVQNANKMFAEDLKQSKEELANRVMMEVHQAGGEHGLWSKGQLVRNQASWNNTKPIYAAERTGSSTFVQLVKGLFKGQYNWAIDMEEAKAFRQKVATKYGFKNWDMEKTYKFTSSSGIEFELNLDQIMSLYAYAKREQAHDHLMKGGFVFGKNTEVVVSKNGIKRTYLNKSAKAHNISDEIMGEIVSKLSAEQKGFVDEMQDYLSTTMGNKGNEVSLRLYGVKLFMEKFYFPLRSAGQFKEKAKEAELKQQQGQISIANSGFTKAVTPKANNPVVLDGFTDVWAGHVNEMSLYHSMVLPMEDFRRVYNYASPNMEGQESASVNSFIENAYGDAATGYFDQLYKELNGGAIIDPRENLSKQMIGKFKKSAVMLSNSVWVQQFSAIGRAYALIDPKYFIGQKVDKKRHDALWDEVKQYAPVAIIKEMGGFDTHTGLSAKDYLLAEEYGKGERFKALIKDKQFRDELMGWLPAKADELTWCAIWEAVKRETKAKNSDMDVKSEEFLKKAGERFSEVIEKTQVYDSVLARSANMRSKQGLMQMLTSFMAEPTTTVNMIEDALRKGDKKTIARTFGAVAVSIILNNALASVVYAMRDDDEDETFVEKYAQAFTSGMLDDMNPLTYYPILKDIWSLFQGYDVERSDMAIYSDIADAVKKVVTTISQYEGDMDEDEASEYYKKVTAALMSLLDAGASAFGIPWKNVRRDLKSYGNTVKTLYGDWFSDRDTTWNSYWDAVGGAALDSIPVVGLVAGDSKTDKLYDAIVKGDTAYANRLKSGYKDQNAINNAIRKALRENDPRIREAAIAWNANDLDEYMRIAKEIIAEKHFVQDDVVMAIRAEANALTPDDGTETASKAKGMFTAEKFAEAIAQGDQAMANAIKTDIIQTAEKNGKTQKEAEKSFVSSAKSELKDLFLAGDVSEKQAIDALTTYCGLDKDDAKADVQYWAFNQDYPNISVDDAWFDKYYDDVADSGIRIDVYMNYRNQAKNVTGEDKKEKKMAIINSLPITSAQKDALYFAEGWAESKLYEAPWH